LRVAVLFGGPSPEAEVSRRSARSVISALEKSGHTVFGVELSQDLPQKIVEINPDKVFIVLHGSPGEDGTVQGLLEIMNLPYTGCNTQASAVCMDKDITKRVLKTYGVPVPSGETYFDGDKVESKEIPCVVKPARAGSTVGTTLVKEKAEFEKAVQRAFRYDRKILVEEYIEGRELTVGVLNGTALPPVEIITETGFYDYSAKYEDPATSYIVPAPVSDRLARKLKELSEKVYKVLECKGAVRIDYRVDRWGNPFVLEVNTIPGMTERSLLPKAAKAVGISFPQLIERILAG